MSSRTLVQPETKASQTRSRLPIFILCWLCLLADGYDLLAYGATLPSLIGRPPFSLTLAQGGQIASLALVGMLVGCTGAGMLTDRLGRRRIFIASVTTFSVAMLLASVAPTVELFVAFRVLTCLGVGGLLPTAIALASEFAAPERRSRTLGLVLTGPPCGMVLAALVSSLVVPNHGFRPVYASAGLILILVPLLVKFLPESPAFLAVRGHTEQAAVVRSTYGLPALPAGDAAVGRSPLSAVVRDGNLVPTLLIWATKVFGLLTVFGLTTWLPQVMATSGYGLGSSIAFLLVYSLGGVVGTVVASSIAERMGPKPLVIVGYLAAAGALLCISQRPETVLLVLLVLITGFGGFGTQNVLNDFIARFYPTANRASGLGWALGIGALGSIAGPSFGAAVVDTTSPLTTTATAFAITAVIGAVMMICTPRKAPSLVAQEKAAAADLVSDKAGAGQVVR